MRNIRLYGKAFLLLNVKKKRLLKEVVVDFYSILKSTVKRTPLNKPLKKLKAQIRQRTQITEWGKNGKLVPPPHVIKQITLRSYAKMFGLRIFVETGTYYGGEHVKILDNLLR